MAEFQPVVLEKKALKIKKPICFMHFWHYRFIRAPMERTKSKKLLWSAFQQRESSQVIP